MFSHRNFVIIKILLLAIFLIFPSFVFAKDKPVGQVIAIRGTVEFSLGSKNPKAGPQDGIKKVGIPPWEKAVFHQDVFASDKFRTAQGSRLKILFEDKSLISLGPNSTMKVDSYLYKPEDKLRQGVINVMHGFSMYIVNKSLKNKKSYFKIVTPTANIAARGTQGYTSVSPDVTLVANQAGAVVTQNIDPKVLGKVIVGAMMKTIIKKGLPPFSPKSLTKEELKQIRNVILGRIGIGTTSQSEDGEDALIEEVDEADISIEAKAGEGESDGTEGPVEVAASPFGQDFADFINEFFLAVGFGTAADFAEFNQPFDTSFLNSCSTQKL